MNILGKIASACRSVRRPDPGSAPGRNEPCWCGSGQKYKRCHLDADGLKAQAQRTACRTSA